MWAHLTLGGPRFAVSGSWASRFRFSLCVCVCVWALGLEARILWGSRLKVAGRVILGSGRRVQGRDSMREHFSVLGFGLSGL